MEERENPIRKDELFSRKIRAGKRTYFFDVKETKGEEKYITITESKRRFNEEDGKFSYEKHKIFLYKEDFEKFLNGLTDSLHYVETGEMPVDLLENEDSNNSGVDDTWFDDLEKNND